MITKRLNAVAAKCVYPLMDWLVRFRKYICVLHLRDAMLAATVQSRKGPLLTLKLRDSDTSVWLRPGTSDFAVFMKVFVEEEYLLPYTIQPKTIVDAGANTGLATVYFALKYPDARIFSIEPEKSNFELCRKNTRSLLNVESVEAALWNRETMLTLKNAEEEPWAFQFAEGDGPQVQTTTVPKIMKRLGTVTIDILKIDIEGAEYAIFDESAEEWLDHVRVLIVELHDQYQAGATERFVRRLATRSFQSLVFGESLYIYFTKNASNAPWALTKDRHG